MIDNEFDKAFIVSDKGISRMEFHYQWEHEEALKRGLRNPWDHKPNKPIHVRETIYPDPNNKKHGIQTTRSVYPKVNEKEMIAWENERDNYIQQRDEWIALQIFHEYGYEAFLDECQIYNLSEQFCKSVFPCESQSEAQCNLYCPIYKDCALRIWEGDEEN